MFLNLSINLAIQFFELSIKLFFFATTPTPWHYINNYIYIYLISLIYIFIIQNDTWIILNATSIGVVNYVANGTVSSFTYI